VANTSQHGCRFSQPTAKMVAFPKPPPTPLLHQVSGSTRVSVCRLTNQQDGHAGSAPARCHPGASAGAAWQLVGRGCAERLLLGRLGHCLMRVRHSCQRPGARDKQQYIHWDGYYEAKLLCYPHACRHDACNAACRQVWCSKSSGIYTLAVNLSSASKPNEAVPDKAMIHPACHVQASGVCTCSLDCV
jgi:hypothetical protein